MQTLRVYPNPWAAFDKNGVPCGVCPRDPDADAGGPGQFVGARVDKKNTRVLQDFAAAYAAKFGPALAAKLANQEHRSPIQATFYEYLGIASSDLELAEKLAAKDPIEIPATKYYKDRLREGALIPADRATATKVKLTVYVEPAIYFATRSMKSEAPALTASVAVDGKAVAGTVETGGSSLSLGTLIGGFDPPKGDEQELLEAAPADAVSANSNSKKASAK
jgi:hypothetical protein